MNDFESALHAILRQNRVRRISHPSLTALGIYHSRLTSRKISKSPADFSNLGPRYADFQWNPGTSRAFAHLGTRLTLPRILFDAVFSQVRLTFDCTFERNCRNIAESRRNRTRTVVSNSLCECVAYKFEKSCGKSDSEEAASQIGFPIDVYQRPDPSYAQVNILQRDRSRDDEEFAESSTTFKLLSG
ncbi:hypothetical protein K0M31_005883 [Melipona bicolor]|uniref:Uncharacterized protein n=1 Tax=Melipona bicolor TaxID=60889 RepID=A0AA40FV04_9HYME|nr:hypothetical protein K0M31_005883 [Melipona bicolor]